jgi:hypothetical protein
MNYQYLFCATCGQRRTGHAYRCSVCNNLLRRPEPRQIHNVHHLQPVVRGKAPEQRVPVAA